MSDKVFDTARDKDLIAAGTHFYCQGHMTARPLAERSSDERYCQACFDCLTNEARLMKEQGIRRSPDWIPKAGRRLDKPLISIGVNKAVERQENVIGDNLLPQVLLPMTPESNKTSATPTLRQPEKIKVKSPEKDKGGRPEKDIPLARIAELRAEGMGVKGIAGQLKLEGIDVTAMTVSRKLRGH